MSVSIASQRILHVLLSSLTYTLLESVFKFCADVTGAGKHIDYYKILVE